MRFLLAAASVAALCLTASAEAGTPYVRQVTCPIDGRNFAFTDTMSYSTWGNLLDGQPLGSWHMPLPVPQCPESNFPVYQDEFTEEELTALRTLAASADYQSIRDESSYFILRWVLQRMMPDREPIDDAWTLLSATWQVRDEPDRYRRYVAEVLPLLETASDPMQSSEPDDWSYVQIVMANLSRQSGDFDTATQRLDTLSGDLPPHLAERIALTRELIAARNAEPRGVEPDHPGDH